MADLKAEIKCPACGETRLASSFLTSKVSGNKICVACFRKEKKAGAAGETAPAAAASAAGQAVKEAPAAAAAVATTPASAAAPAAGAAASAFPTEGMVKCPVCEKEVDAKRFVTSRKSGQKICNTCYLNERKAGRADQPGAAGAAAPKAAGKPKPAAAKAAAATPPGAGSAAAAVATAEAAPGRVRAQTVSLRTVTDPTGEMDRRSFLGYLALGWAAFTAAMAQSTIALGRFMFPNVLFEPPSTFKIGFPEEFELGKVEEKFKARYGIWVVRSMAGSEDVIFVISTVCTHLGCTPNWLETEQKYKCPCHGSGFRKDGINFEGPAPRPLERFRVVRAEDGQMLVDTSKKFQYELGQWNDPESYLVV